MLAASGEFPLAETGSDAARGPARMRASGPTRRLWTFPDAPRIDLPPAKAIAGAIRDFRSSTRQNGCDCKRLWFLSGLQKHPERQPTRMTISGAVLVVTPPSLQDLLCRPAADAPVPAARRGSETSNGVGDEDAEITLSHQMRSMT
jgi:hypothetical protein